MDNDISPLTLHELGCNTEQTILESGKVFIRAGFLNPSDPREIDFFFSARVYEAYKKTKATLRSPADFEEFIEQVGVVFFMSENFADISCVPAESRQSELQMVFDYAKARGHVCMSIVDGTVTAQESAALSSALAALSSWVPSDSQAPAPQAPSVS